MTILTYEEMIARIPDIARSWLGTPYHMNACVKGKGVDCARFITSIFKEAGFIPHGFNPDPALTDWIYGKNVDTEMFMRDLLKFGYKISLDDRLPGDVISFMFNGVESHVAVLVENDHIIHAVSEDKVMEHPLKAFWLKICCVYRAKEIGYSH